MSISVSIPSVIIYALEISRLFLFLGRCQTYASRLLHVRPHITSPEWINLHPAQNYFISSPVLLSDAQNGLNKHKTILFLQTTSDQSI
jgi:hypothetical protein